MLWMMYKDVHVQHLKSPCSFCKSKNKTNICPVENDDTKFLQWWELWTNWGLHQMFRVHPPTGLCFFFVRLFSRLLWHGISQRLFNQSFFSDLCLFLVHHLELTFGQNWFVPCMKRAKQKSPGLRWKRAFIIITSVKFHHPSLKTTDIL